MMMVDFSVAQHACADLAGAFDAIADWSVVLPAGAVAPELAAAIAAFGRLQQAIAGRAVLQHLAIAEAADTVGGLL
jgi:hypothetical protein